ncbi:ras GEF [Obba rivulosa]|uniref:Ras GEF n=1 Tax=Obba rivulosa TaxID=1052685 RepID=A0A8E2DEJ4_9APHY|nr:ras GEF [Obba rivulosa]
MPSAKLTIDTSIANAAGPSSSRGLSAGSRTPGSARSNIGVSRLRSASTVSTSSSVSAATRNAPSSFKSTHVSIPLPGDGRAGDTATWSPAESKFDEIVHSSRDYVLAMHDFVPQHQNVTCLAFDAGQVIHVLNRDASGWWDGEVDGRRGWFPSNYVTSEVGLLTEAELPITVRSLAGHSHTMSSASATSWASARPLKQRAMRRTDHRPTTTDSTSSTMDTYCPPLMVPLLRSLSLLQNAVRTNRIAHFQPAAAYIISCVRTILTETGCLARDALALKTHGVLAQERKRILSDLALMVSQAKLASEENTNEESRELETEAMVRLGGQLFARVRGFLAVAVQCGINLPPSGDRGAASGSDSESNGRWDSEGTLVRSDRSNSPPVEEYGEYWQDSDKTTNGIARRHQARPRSESVTKSALGRARSLGDLKARKKLTLEDAPPLPTSANSLISQERRFASVGGVRHKGGEGSVSSVSSSSSYSSGDSIGTPATPAFPSGPSTTSEVLEALRYTLDHYLSTIAAFIGHVHSYSRTSHASSTGHMYDLVREVVDMVCKLLTIVEAVLKHPDIPAQRSENLRAAEEGLYNATSKLADTVRLLTSPPPPDSSEEEEKATLLSCATRALKAGSDCVNAVKKCLTRATGEKAIVIQLPLPGDFDAMYTPRKFTHRHTTSGHRVRKSSSMRALRGLYEMNGVGDDEDLTIQAQSYSEATPVRPQRTSVQKLQIPVIAEPEAVLDSDAKTNHDRLPSPDAESMLPLRPSLDSNRSDLPSPTSFVHTIEDDRTTWEGSQRGLPSSQALEEKLLNGELPAVPPSSLPPDFVGSTPISWTLRHDHSSEDVAYNSDGQLVGATLAALVERMTPHDSIVESAFSSVFFLTFRLFTTPAELVQAVIMRYNLLPPTELSTEDMYMWQRKKGLPVRLRVSNFVKSWLENYWRPSSDNVVLPVLQGFTQDALAQMFPIPSQKILELIDQWQTTGVASTGMKLDRVRDAGIPLNPPSIPPSEVPRPIMTKTLLSALRNKNFASISVTDFDPLELARQLTTMECTLYCAIQPEEVLETGQQGGTYPVNVKALTSLSTVITGWVAESILNELDMKKRTALVKFFIKLADRCTSLHNFSTPRSILAALDSSTISRLHQTWLGLPQKNKLQLESLRKLADHARNYHEYRSRLRNTAPPAVPFLGLYLTDVTFCREGNPSHRASPMNPDKKLLNFNKYHKLARIVQDMQRFQVPYNLKEIPEVQEYLKDSFEKSKHRGDLQDLYRRSLMVEPKQPLDTPPASDVRQLFNWASRSQAQQPTPTSAS